MGDKPTLSHNNTTHKHLDGSDTFERNLALARCLIQTQLMPQLLFADGVGMIDLIPKHQEGDLCKFFHGKEGIELGFGLGESFDVLGVDKENDSVDFGEVVFPETAGCGYRVYQHYVLFFLSSNSPCLWPPRSKVVNLLFPITSSSDAADQNRSVVYRLNVEVRLVEEKGMVGYVDILGCAVGCRIATRSF